MNQPHPTTAEGNPSSLISTLRGRRAQILERWQQAAAGRLEGRPALALVDDMAELMSCLADELEVSPLAPHAPWEACQHILSRLGEDIGLGDALRAFTLLRRAIVVEWCPRSTAAVQELLRLEEAFDTVIAGQADRHTMAREDIFRAIDRFSQEALDALSPEALLASLVARIVEASPSADAALGLLRGPGGLARAAATGLGAALTPWLEGRIQALYAEGALLALRAPGLERRIGEDVLAEAGFGSLTAEPIVDAQELYGVVVIASKKARFLSRGDRTVLSVLSGRAAAALSQQRLRASLDEERARLNAVIDQLPVAVWIAEAPGGRIVLENRRATEMIKLYRDAIEQTHEHRSTAHELGAHRGPDERSFEACGWTLARALDGEVVSEEVHLVTRGGEQRISVVRAAPVRAAGGQQIAAVGVAEDITARRLDELRVGVLEAASVALLERRDVPAALLEVARLAVPHIADGCLFALEEGPAARPALIVVHREPGREAAAVAAFRRAGPDAALAALEAKAPLRLELAAHGRVFGALALVHSESRRRFGPGERAFAEELSRRVALALENAALFREQRAAVHAREHILAVVAHDLKNPLSAVQMNTQLLLRTAAKEGGRALRIAETLSRATARMTRMINDLVDLRAVQSGRLPLEPMDEPVRSVLEEAKEEARALAAEGDVSVDIVTEGPLGEVRLDRQRVLQVLSNLIGNAVKASPPGGRVELGARARDEGAVLWWVKDEGHGIAAEELEHLFEPYWRSRKAAYAGAGLGLAISQGIVRAHGGQLWAESVPGQGATFAFTLAEGSGRGEEEG